MSAGLLKRAQKAVSGRGRKINKAVKKAAPKKTTKRAKPTKTAMEKRVEANIRKRRAARAKKAK